MHTQLENSQARQGQSKKSNDFNSPVSKHSQVLVKAQLDMTTPGDSDEQEADEMADSIVSEGRIARSVSIGHSGGGVSLPSEFSSRIASFQGQGSRMTGDLKTQMESGFGRDFSNVRLHTDDAAAEMSSSISAKAFTYGNDIFFNRGHFSPETNEGQHLIAHELTHVVQGNRKVSRKGLTQEQLYSTIEKYYLLEGDNIKEADCDRFTNLALQLDKDHMKALLKDHYSSIEYLMDHSSENFIRLNLKFNPDKFSYLREQYSYLSPNEVLLLNMLTYKAVSRRFSRKNSR